jgi:3-deoxy-D-manno-octulosonic-acid transferase
VGGSGDQSHCVVGSQLVLIVVHGAHEYGGHEMLEEALSNPRVLVGDHLKNVFRQHRKHHLMGCSYD